jgi:cytochrome o ubiquinol oxidase operon protein cyoD
MTLSRYIWGYVLSIILTFSAVGFFYWHLATGHVFPTHEMLRVAFVILALLQLEVQLMFFLHIGHEGKPRWNLIALLFALLVVFILVGGTLWIMNNLQVENPMPIEFLNDVPTPANQLN